MFSIYHRSSPNTEQKNLGFGVPMSWDTEQNFLNYIRLMGCPEQLVEQFIKTQQVTFVVDVHGVEKLHFYTTSKKLAHTEEDHLTAKAQADYMVLNGLQHRHQQHTI